MSDIYCKGCKYRKSRGVGYGSPTDYCLKEAPKTYMGKVDYGDTELCSIKNKNLNCKDREYKNTLSKFIKILSVSVGSIIILSMATCAIISDPKMLVGLGILVLPIVCLLAFVFADMMEK